MHKDNNSNNQNENIKLMGEREREREREREKESLRIDCNKYFWHYPHQGPQDVRTILNICRHSAVVIYDIRERRNPD
jgi:predicted solute-binding protein